MTTDTTIEGSPAARLAELGERYFATQHRYDPYNATLLGLAEFDHLAGDPSIEASEGAAAAFAVILAESFQINEGELSDEEQVDLAVLRVLVEGARGDAEHSLWATNASAKGYVSRQALVFQAVPAMTVADDAGAERYLARLRGIGPMLTALGDRYLAEASRGRIPTALGVEHSIQQLDGYLALDLGADALLAPVRGQEAEPEATRIVADLVRPAMAALASRLREELLPLGRQGGDVGIRHVPGGEKAYLAAVARHTTTALTPEQIHQVGLDTLAALEPRWSDVGERAIGERDFTVIAERMRSDLSLRFETSEQIIEVAQAALDRANAARARLFPPYDIGDCVLEVINPIDAEHTALAYYRPPAVDGSRPGAHCLLASAPETRFRFEYECLAFHESVPGHHLQLATAQTLDIPRYRRYLDVEACSFNEGWGLYSEQLADETGLYTDDVARLGMLSFLALRASRLVVDTGIHWLGWTREEAIEFMWNHTVTTRAHVMSEVDRYIAWPGQALAYLVGQREILRLRQRAMDDLGDDFSLIDFHGAVLQNGALPLSVLDGRIARWQASVPRS